MKNLSKYLILSILTLGVISCSNDDDNTPDPVNEEEVITTMTVTLTPEGGGTPVTLQSRDLDGDGPDPQVIVVSGNLVEGTTYNGTVVLLNETETPAEDITEEVEAESDEHQFFFIPSSGLDVTITYSNFDGDGNPLGTEFSLVANSTGTGTINIVLRHEPMKPNDGTLGDAGGETDISVTFDLEIE